MRRENKLAICRTVITSFIFSQLWVQTIAQTSTGVAFMKAKGWQEVLVRAKAEKKGVFVDAYTTWCGPCKMMDNNTYPDSSLGALMNDKFISIKVQMDSAKGDDNDIRSWYADAEALKRSAQIVAFPTLLFYSPDGDLLLSTIGYKDVPALKILAEFAGNPTAASELRIGLQDYKDGKRDYTKMIGLSRFAKQILRDDKLALQIAKDYKSGHLDGIPMREFYTNENITFIREYNLDLVELDDKFFQLCYNEPNKIDTIIGKGTAGQYVPLVIARDLVNPRLYKEGNAIITSPKWSVIQAEIRERYPKINVQLFMLDQKIAFAEATKQWVSYTEFVSEKFKSYPPKKDDAFNDVNGSAWKVFLNTDNKAALERALSWSNLSIELLDYLQHYDTKANILYRLGRKSEAIQWQEKAVKANEELTRKEGRNWFPEYKENLDKMLKGEPTWPTK